MQAQGSTLRGLSPPDCGGSSHPWAAHVAYGSSLRKGVNVWHTVPKHLLPGQTCVQLQRRSSVPAAWLTLPYLRPIAAACAPARAPAAPLTLYSHYHSRHGLFSLVRPAPHVQVIWFAVSEETCSGDWKVGKQRPHVKSLESLILPSQNLTQLPFFRLTLPLTSSPVCAPTPLLKPSHISCSEARPYMWKQPHYFCIIGGHVAAILK